MAFFVGDTLFLGLGFGQAHPGDFGICVGHGRNGQRLEESLVSGDVFRRHLAFMHRLVRQHGVAHHVADRVDVRYIGLHLGIDGDEAALIDRHACGFRRDVAPVGTTAHRHQRAVVQLWFGSLVAFKGHSQTLRQGLDLADLGLEVNGFVALFDTLVQWAHQVLVRAGNQAVGQFHHADFGA